MAVPFFSGGFNDSYRDPVFRMAKTLPIVRGIVGPWCHDWPDCNRPGKEIISSFVTLAIVMVVHCSVV